MKFPHKILAQIFDQVFIKDFKVDTRKIKQIKVSLDKLFEIESFPLQMEKCNFFYKYKVRHFSCSSIQIDQPAMFCCFIKTLRMLSGDSVCKSAHAGRAEHQSAVMNKQTSEFFFVNEKIIAKYWNLKNGLIQFVLNVKPTHFPWNPAVYL